MPHHPNLTIQLTPQELDAIRALARQLDLVSVGGIRTGEGSPRRLMQALAQSVRTNGLERTAEAIKPLLPEKNNP